MKNKLILGLALLCSLIILGCTTTAQRTAFNTIGTLDQSAKALTDSYFDLVIHGVVTTNALPQVALRANQFRKALLLASTVAQNGTNALASAALTAELADLTSFIGSLETSTKK